MKAEKIRRGSLLYRFHGYALASKLYPGDAFNPFLKPGFDWTDPADGARFSPFPWDMGYMPALYAAADVRTACFESVLHDVPHVRGHEVLWEDLQLARWHLTTLKVMQPIVVAHLTTPNLNGLSVPGRTQSLTVAELMHSERAYYPRTRAWAWNLHGGMPAINGLRYGSRLGDGKAYVLYGDERWIPGALQVVHAPLSIEDPVLRKLVAKAVDEAHLVLKS